MKHDEPLIEPVSVWSLRRQLFDDSVSTTQNILLTHGATSLVALIRKIDFLNHIISLSPTDNIATHALIPETLSELFFHQGAASTMLFDDSPKRSKENARTHALRMERFEYVRKFCHDAGFKPSVLNDRVMRNTIVHTDEYLERALRSPNTGWLIDTAIISRDAFAPEKKMDVGYCRCFIVSEKTLLHLGAEASAQALREEAAAVLALVFGLPPPPLFPLK